MRSRPRRRGYSLLEVILALGLSLILVAGIYSAVQMTYQQWEVGRQAADEAQLVRALFQRVRADLHGTLTTWTPPQAAQPSTGGATAAAGATGAGATSGATGVATGSTSSPPSAAADPAANNPTEFPPGGLHGTSDGFSVVVRATPADLDFGANLPASKTASVLRTITYRVGTLEDSSSIDDGVEGLVRDESPRLPDSMAPDGHSADGRSDLLAPEVKKIRLSYYDGLFWNDAWDLTQTGAPVCVHVEVGLKLSTLKNADADGLRWYHAVIALPPAAAGSTPPASASSSGSSSSGAPSAGGASTGTGASGGTTTGGAGS